MFALDSVPSPSGLVEGECALQQWEKRLERRGRRFVADVCRIRNTIPLAKEPIESHPRVKFALRRYLVTNEPVEKVAVVSVAAACIGH